MLVTSFAVSMILQVLFQNFISTRSQPVLLPQILSDSITIGGMVIGVNKIAAIVATIVMLVFFGCVHEIPENRDRHARRSRGF
ncbi:MAG: branched-chain amino acid transport system permease protein [Paracoccaceae bacterium]|jgi:branched-chain amino acid transport system permease protein